MKRILVLAHREELIYQAVAHARNAGLTASAEMGQSQAGFEDVVVSTVQTQCARRKCRSCKGGGCHFCEFRGSMLRMERFNPYQFGLVIIDEGHHAAAPSYRKVLAWYKQNPNLRVLLVTATPKRADGIGLHNVCDSVAFEMGLRSAISDGWLVPIRQRFVTVQSLDLSKVKTKAGGDLADGELERAFLGETDVEEEQMLHALAKPTLDEAKGKPVLFFSPGVAHAEKMMAAFNAYDGVTAECVIGETDKAKRKDIIKRFKDGETQVLVGCGVFTEGFDAPGTEVVAIARPTKSESLYLQMIGRGTRPLPGIVEGIETGEARRLAIAASGKPNCIVLDFVGNSGNHKLVSVADVLAGADVDPIDLDAALSEAREVAEPVDMEELVAKAKQAREAKERKAAEEAEERRKRMSTQHKADRATYQADDVDLFGGRSFGELAERFARRGSGNASPRQKAYLVKLGVSPERADQCSRQQAGSLIEKLKKQSGADFIVSFGKHAGKKLRDVPKGYVNYMMTQSGPAIEELRKHVSKMRNENAEQATF